MDIRDKRIAILAPVAWRTPPRAYGAWETVASNIAEGLVARGWKNITLFATKDSVTKARLVGFIERGYEEDKSQVPLVSTCLHISKTLERAVRGSLAPRRNAPSFQYSSIALTKTCRAKQSQFRERNMLTPA